MLDNDDFVESLAVGISISIIGLLISPIIVVVNIFALKNNITAILNPDWYIINNILKSFIQQ
jgi:hypothetical protein